MDRFAKGKAPVLQRSELTILFRVGVLTMHLFGKRRAQEPPLTPVGVRVRRLRMAAGLEFARWVPLLKFMALGSSLACLGVIEFCRVLPAAIGPGGGWEF